jgi:tetratricopeptide (TPR) repeat protein/nucleoside phosphorylase
MPLTTPPILIVTVTSIENLAILDAFSASAANARQMLAGKIYYALGPCGGVPIFLVQSEAGAATPSGSLLTVDQAISDLAPQVVILCGVTCGFRPETQALGELLIASQLICYEPQKITVHHGRIPRGDRVAVSARPLGYLRSAVLDWNTPTHFGPILSGEKWIDDPAFRAELLQTEPEAIGAETEGAGLYAAAHGTKTDWILVKAISRWPGSPNDPATQQTAAANAARFIRHALQIVPWATPAADPGTPTPPIDLSALSAPRNELFLGRQAELETLQCHLSGDPRTSLIAICAAPGQGKTTLARQAAERFGTAFAGGVLAISLENPLTRPELVSQIAAFLGLDTTPNPPQLERQVLRALERRPTTLLLLDNAETHTHALQRDDPAALDLNDLLQNQLPPTVTLLVTSRTRFTLGWAHEFTLDLRGLSPVEGAQLFQQHAPDRRAALDPAPLEALSVKLEGHPLSLRLLASAFNDSGLPLPAFLSRFETHLIAAKKHAKKPAQRTLIASIETSIEPLDSDLKTLFYNLALFHAPFRASDAAAILAPDAKASLLPTHLHHLWQHGLLERQFHPTGTTQLELYHLLPPLRLYAEQTVPLPPEILPRFAQVYGDLISWIRNEIDKDPIATLLVRLCAPDLERALEHTQNLACARYNRCLGYVEFRLGHPWKGKSRLEQALAWARDHDQQLVSHTLNDLGLICDSTGQRQDTLKYCQESLQIDKEIGSRAEEAITLNNIGAVYHNIAQHQEALKYYREALSIHKEVGDRAEEATTLNNIGAVYHAIEQPQEALKYYREALPISQKVGNRAMEAIALNNIGGTYKTIGQHQKALKYYRKALPIHKEVGDRVGEATTLNNIGVGYHEIGQSQKALKYFREALLIYREVGNRAGEANVLNNIGRAHKTIRQPQKALQYYLEALLVHREVGNRAGEANTLNNIGGVYHTIGQPQEALKYYREVLPIRQEVGNRAGKANTLNNIGGVYHSIGQPQEALKYFREALSIYQEVSDRVGEASTLNNIAGLLFNERKNQQAFDLFQQSLNIFQEVGAVASEAAILCNMAFILGTRLNNPTQALPLLRHSIELLKTNGLPQDSSGATLADHESLLAKLEAQV